MVLNVDARSMSLGPVGASLGTRPTSATPGSPGAQSAVELGGSLPEGLSPVRGTAPSAPSDTQLAAAAAVVAATLGDPMALMLAIQSELKDKGLEAREVDARNASLRHESADVQRLEHLERSVEMAKKASRKCPRWVKRLIGAVLSAVGSIASLAGGAGLALVAVGAALMIAAKLVEKVMSKLAEAGLISEKAASIVSAVVKIAAAVAAAVTGQVGQLANAAKAAMDVASTAIKVVKSVADMVSAASEVALAGVDMHSSVRTYQSQVANIMAEQWGLEVDGSLSDMEKAADQVKSITESWARMLRTANAALASQHDAGMTAARGIA